MTSRNVLFIVILSIFVVGCQDGHIEHGFSHSWEPVVQRFSQHDNVNFTAGSTTIRATEKRKIHAMIEKAKPDMKLYARVQAPKSAHANVRTLIERRLQCVRKYLVSSGIYDRDIERIFTEPVQHLEKEDRNTVLVILDQYKVTPPDCPGWQIMNSNIAPNGEEQFGCATAENLAHMIAEPRDLYKGQKAAPGDGSYQAGAITRYRTDKIKELKIEKVDKQS